MHGVTRSVQSLQETAWRFAVLCAQSGTARSRARLRAPLTIPTRNPTTGCGRLIAPAPPRQGRAARCAPECAHALKAVANAVADRRIRRGSALRRRRRHRTEIDPSHRHHRHQSDPRALGTFQRRSRTFRTSHKIPNTSQSSQPGASLRFHRHNVDEKCRTFLRRLRTFHRPSETSQNVPRSTASSQGPLFSAAGRWKAGRATHHRAARTALKFRKPATTPSPRSR